MMEEKPQLEPGQAQNFRKGSAFLIGLTIVILLGIFASTFWRLSGEDYLVSLASTSGWQIVAVISGGAVMGGVARYGGSVSSRIGGMIRK